ncbi:hypothetical protein BKA70DRAFT_1404087 [Coprinopsis sp. MPI-PUGE-AT-0042]|nr:hypothetical protein BKA70DRAFT_1404087 [Coprinopsis sp. MPI-PUGE-AT-0042]
MDGQDDSSFAFDAHSTIPFKGFWQERIAHLRPLVSAGIPCALWGYDVLDLLFANGNIWGTQEIVVPDNALDATSQILHQKAGYLVVPTDDEYIQRLASINCAIPYPDSIKFKLPLEIAKDNFVGTAPETVTVHPQSYFGELYNNLGKEQKNPRRFIRLPSDLDERILTPNLHTLLEGLIHCLFYPPSKGAPPPWCWKDEMDALICEAEDRLEEKVAELTIMKKLSTDKAKWYMGYWFKNHRRPSIDQIAEFKDRRRRLPLNSQLKDRGFPLATSHGLGAATVNASRRQYSTTTRFVRSGCRVGGVAPPPLATTALKKAAELCLSGILRRKAAVA